MEKDGKAEQQAGVGNLHPPILPSIHWIASISNFKFHHRMSVSKDDQWKKRRD